MKLQLKWSEEVSLPRIDRTIPDDGGQIEIDAYAWRPKYPRRLNWSVRYRSKPQTVYIDLNGSCRSRVQVEREIQKAYAKLSKMIRVLKGSRR